MIVNNENYKTTFEIFKSSCDIAKFVSFDCEMTGLNIEMKTEPTKYDTQEFRYYKVKQGVEKFDLIQFGLTFFIEKEKVKNENENENKTENKKEEYYLERSFTFYLFKYPRIKFFNNEKNRYIFNLESLAHPNSLKFLRQNNFDFNELISKGIHYTKLTYADKIKENLINEKNIINICTFFLNKENEKNLVENIIKLAEFLLLTKLESGKKKPILLLKFDNKQTMNFFLGYNFKQGLYIDNFNIQKLKNEENTVEVKITKNIDSALFEINYNSLDNFKNLIRSNPKMIYELKYQPQNKINEIINGENDINKLVEEELGFVKYIKYLSDKKIPIIGHNMYFDTMFIYDKLIGDLPDDFYNFKTEIHKYFPIIYDTKSIAVSLKKYEKSGLDSLHKTLIKNKYNSYVSFVEDIENGFNLYNNNEKLHDAGYDSKITGECFILMNKALENNYIIDNQNDNNKKKKKTKNEKNNQNNNIINNIIKYGFCDLSLFEEFKNISFLSLIESNYGKVFWDVNKQNQDEYKISENSLINKFKNVFMIKFKWNYENRFIINNYEIANLFKNKIYDLNVFQIDYDKAFVEFCFDDFNGEDHYDKIINIIKEVKDRNYDINNKLIIDDVYPYENFINQYKSLLK